MGKMLESLMKLNGQHGGTVDTKPFPCPENKNAAPVEECAEETGEDFQFIEVGAPGKKIEGSPGVLAAGPPSAKAPAAPKIENPKITLVQQTLVPTMTEPKPVGVTFEAWPTPAPARKMAREIIAFHQPQHPIAKQYGELFARMMENLEGEGRVVVFAGAVPQTGTTTVVLNLAFAGCAAGQHRMVVVEGNLLRPAVAQRLAMEKSPGLLDVLAGAVALEKTLVPTVQPQLHVLLAGNQKAMTRKATPEALRWVLGWLRERYEIILVDSPDLSEPQEVESWAAAADGLYLVVPREENGATKVSGLTQTIARRGGRLRGLIHTHFENV